MKARRMRIFGKWLQLKSLFLNADASSISLAAIEDGSACPRTRIRKDGHCLVVEDESVDPIPADDTMPGMQWRSQFIEDTAQQDSAATRTPLHGLLLP